MCMMYYIYSYLFSTDKVEYTWVHTYIYIYIYVYIYEQWKKPGCLGYIGDYTTQLDRDFIKP